MISCVTNVTNVTRILTDHFIRPRRPGFSCDVSCFLLFNILEGTVSLWYFCTEPILGFSVFWRTKYSHAHTFDWQHAPKCTLQSALQKNGQKQSYRLKLEKLGSLSKHQKQLFSAWFHFVRIKYVKGSFQAPFHTLTVINSWCVLVNALSQSELYLWSSKIYYREPRTVNDPPVWGFQIFGPVGDFGFFADQSFLLVLVRLFFPGKMVIFVLDFDLLFR